MATFIPALTLLVCLASTGASSAQEITKPLGRWERKIGKNCITLIIDENRLHISSTGEKPGALHADYAMTRDGVIYGVVTSIECEEDEDMDASKTLFDAPFTFRFRIDEGALIIHDAKLYDVDSKENLWNGRFKAVHPTTARAAPAPPYYTVPASWPYNPSTPPGVIDPSFDTLNKMQYYNFWMGFSR
ncbi:MAG TPA: hypothetical protein VMG10_16595 [Gemmataceae bacterium]|nr:hypothetical protein [Gemmataceae bacterium]